MQCTSAVTLAEPFQLASCMLELGHGGDHRAVLEWDDDDL